MPIRNRRVLAERLRWPAGALEECLRVEKDRPGYNVSWFREWTVPGFERAEGFYAWRTEDKDPLYHGKRRHEWYGKTTEQLCRVLP
ncbi:hypothetical protein OWR29_25635 [Actinoplanes sp. Pm04-4]|uniref:Uncharacterized protein n=1 Tax=Paractinoplanes pyxinae TaxID=2997416 RepID=A0ABT4B4J9_9ACTN|nr:hypothetical protein [Actinoplanes pyxinae]MCY1141395.1 hypothetical protein [Actinoplanes pyxinae]